MPTWLLPRSLFLGQSLHEPDQSPDWSSGHTLGGQVGDFSSSCRHHSGDVDMHPMRTRIEIYELTEKPGRSTRTGRPSVGAWEKKMMEKELRRENICRGERKIHEEEYVSGGRSDEDDIIKELTRGDIVQICYSGFLHMLRKHLPQRHAPNSIACNNTDRWR